MNVWIDERLYEWVRVESARRRVPIWEIVETALEKYKKDKEGSA